MEQNNEEEEEQPDLEEDQQDEEDNEDDEELPSQLSPISPSTPGQFTPDVQGGMNQGSPASPEPPASINSMSPEEEAAEKINDIRQLLEQELAFDAWCSKGPFWSPNESSSKEPLYRAKIAEMVRLLKKTVPRESGYGWKLQKTHEILHIPEYVTKFGHSRNFDSGHGESALKEKAKKPSHTAQKRSYNQFQEQVCDRIDAFQLKSKVHNCMGRLSDREEAVLQGIRGRIQAKQSLESRVHGDDFEVTNVLQNKCWKMQVKTDLPSSGPPGSRPQAPSDRYQFSLFNRKMVDYFPPFAKQQLYEWLKATFPLTSYNVRVKSYSELVRERKDGGRVTDSKLFRAHHDYQTGGAWYDWVLTSWEDEETGTTRKTITRRVAGSDSDDEEDGVVQQLTPPSDNGFYPAKILAFFQISLSPIPGVSMPEELSEYQKEHLVGEGLSDTNPLCLLHCTDRPSGGGDDSDDPTGDSALTCKFNLEYYNNEPVFRIVPVSCIEKQCFVIENTPGIHEHLDEEGSSVRYVADHDTEWGSLF